MSTVYHSIIRNNVVVDQALHRYDKTGNREELDRTSSVIHTHHDYLVGMDSLLKKDLTLYTYLCTIVTDD